MRRLIVSLVLSVLASSAMVGITAASGDEGPVHEIVFPVVGDVVYQDTYGAPRSGGRTHAGQDLMGDKMLPLVATADGTITHLTNGALAGNMIQLTAEDGWIYSYLHLNNDTPGTDDGAADAEDVFGPGIELGAEVEAGQLIGYLGDSGNAEETEPHLHFEMKSPKGVTVNPYASLQAATRVEQASGASASPIPRLAGVNRVATAIAVSKAGWPRGADDVVLAAGDRYAEALPASVLAGARGGPLLLTIGDALADGVAAELDRLDAERVVVVGSVPAVVDTTLAGLGLIVSRVGVADDAVTTATAVAKEVGGAPDTAVLVNQGKFADGVSATTIATGRGWPVLLTDTTTVPQRTADTWRALGVRRVVLVGGTSVISEKIEAFVRDAGKCAGVSGCTVERLAGDNRYATSVAVAERSIDLGGRSASTLLLGTGTAYPDVLASGPLAHQQAGVALLVDGTGSGADEASREFLEDEADDVDEVSILGGSSAVGPAADRVLQEILGLE